MLLRDDAGLAFVNYAEVASTNMAILVLDVPAESLEEVQEALHLVPDVVAVDAKKEARLLRLVYESSSMYAPLAAWLLDAARGGVTVVTLAFVEVEWIIGRELPATAW